ncbi:MAG: hypothetical protein JO307_25590 [Bryobacterales bacterium]|nr:hypothetical protein [Bryobacterales bacterium]MBV9399111.1 hypothetical protein [Bryobacterales bacterium]
MKAVITIALISACAALAQAPQGKQDKGKAAPQPMSFFVTSVGLGKGADLGGLAGADQHCQMLAAAAGRGNATWHAYMSTQGAGAVNARDRIGSGPWYNAKGQQIAANVAELHGDTIEQARLGNRISKSSALTEKGEMIHGVGDQPNEHDMLTGSTPDGRAFTDNADHTCKNWTSSSDGTAMLGHADRLGGPNASWNSVHPSQGCSQQQLVATGGAGLFYCFAVGQ